MTSKASFFAALEQLDYPEDLQDEYDDSLERLFRETRTSVISNIATATASDQREPLGPGILPRVNSDTYSSLKELPSLKKEPFRERSKSTDFRARSDPSEKLGTMSGGLDSKKRKRVYSIKLVPERQRIFKSLVFCK